MKEITSFPKVSLGCFPTPFYKMENLSRKLDMSIYVKRDDLSGLAAGGNKTRKLEYVLADAMAQKCDTVITTGQAQSNHAVLTAVACRKVGLEPILVLKKRGVTGIKGNMLLNKIVDADVRFVDSDHYEDVYREMDLVAEEQEQKNRRPYQIPLGASVPLGCLGYAAGVIELFAQADQRGTRIDHIVCASGSGGTQAGLIVGAKILNKDTKIIGILTSPEQDFDKLVYNLALDTCKLLETDLNISKEDIILKEYIGPGYGLPSAEGTSAIKLVACTEGFLLDPVYTGKAFGGLLSLIREGYFKKNETIVFIHTGGLPALFAVDADYESKQELK